VYFEIQRIASLVAEAASPHRPGFDPEFRLRQELKRLLRDVPESVMPADLQSALVSGDIVGREAAIWLPHVRRWLTEECQRTGD
jgi:hypothetical protein